MKLSTRLPFPVSDVRQPGIGFRLIAPAVASRLILGIAILGGTACGARRADVMPPSAGSEGVVITESDPPAGATSLGSVEGVHGTGCGVFGADGTREGALNALRSAARQRGANFVHVTETVEPHMSRKCFEHEYRIRGEAYAVGAPAR